MEVEKCQVIKGNVQQQFTAPINIAIGPNDEIFVLDSATPKIVILKQDNKDLTIQNTITFKGEGEIKHPLGIAVGNDIIAVSDWSSHSVKLFSFQGIHQSNIGKPGNKDSQFNCPNSVAFNSKGILYVTDYYNYRVQAFDTNCGNQFCGEFGSRGSDPSLFKGYPGYITVDKNDRIYVTDYHGDKINVYDAEDSHDFLYKIHCKSAWAIAVTPDDCLLVSSNKLTTDRLRIFSPSHQIGYCRQLIAKFGSRGNEKGQFKQIYGIAVSKNGTIYVAESGNKRIQIIYT